MKHTLTVERVDDRPDFCASERIADVLAPLDLCHDGPWVRVVGLDVFCDYLNAATDAEAFEALGRKIASLVLGEAVLYREERVA